MGFIVILEPRYSSHCEEDLTTRLMLSYRLHSPRSWWAQWLQASDCRTRPPTHQTGLQNCVPAPFFCSLGLWQRFVPSILEMADLKKKDPPWWPPHKCAVLRCNCLSAVWVAQGRDSNCPLPGQQSHLNWCCYSCNNVLKEDAQK